MNNEKLVSFVGATLAVALNDDAVALNDDDIGGNTRVKATARVAPTNTTTVSDIVGLFLF